MGEFQRQIKDFFGQLCVSQKKISSFLETDSVKYRSFLTEHGGKTINYQKDLRTKVGHRGIVIIIAKIIVTSKAPSGEMFVLAQKDGDKISIPSEIALEWRYHAKTAIEPPVLSAYNKLFAMLGGYYTIELSRIGEKTSTVLYGRDIVYENVNFYKAEISYDLLEKTEKRGVWQKVLIPENDPQELIEYFS